MKRIHSFMIAAVALAGVTMLAAPSAHAGTQVSISIGSGYGYNSRPVYYQAPSCYARPVVYQPAYRYPQYNRGYNYYGNGYNRNQGAYRAPAYRQQGNYYRR